MDYFNKFQKFVSTNMPAIKNPFEKNNQTDVQKDVYSLNQNHPQSTQPQFGGKERFTSTQNTTDKKSASSLSAFLLAEKKPTPTGITMFTNDIAYNPLNQKEQISNFISNPMPIPISVEIPKKDLKPSDDFIKDFKLTRGESPVEWENCGILIDNTEYTCRALITEFQISCIPDYEKAPHINILIANDYFNIPIHMIQSCERTLEKLTMKYLITVKSRDNREMNLIFLVSQNETFYYCLMSLIQAKETPSYVAFAKKYYSSEYKSNGWDLYNPEKEYKRQGLYNLDTTISQGKQFRKTLLNENFLLCETYPQFLITSAQISDEDLKMASLYRTKNRLPSLSYFSYQNSGTVWRCSQNKSGLTNARNEFDEQLLSLIGSIGLEKKLAIFDARPYLSAYANKLKGAGFENIDNYTQAEITFCEIDNIHVARKSLANVYSLINQPKFIDNKKLFASFESTRWPEFIYLLIKSSIAIAASVHKGNATVIHCSDGWDRASQLTAFSQLLIDPYYRTLQGYMVLIEKDFLSFGHQFRFRNGYFSKQEAHEDQNSPIFLQYLDATHQLLIQYPMYFEFNMEFLVFIASNIYNGKYGTFLFNHEKERLEKEAKQKTMSIWTEILEHEERYINSYYDKNTHDSYFFLPQFSYHRIRLWEEYFMKYSQFEYNLNYNQYLNIKDIREETSILHNNTGDNDNDNDNDNRKEMKLSYMQYYITEGIKQKEIISENEKKTTQMKKCIAHLIEKCEGISFEKYDEISPEIRDMMAEIAKEELNGTIEKDKEGTKIVFSKNITE